MDANSSLKMPIGNPPFDKGGQGGFLVSPQGRGNLISGLRLLRGTNYCLKFIEQVLLEQRSNFQRLCRLLFREAEEIVLSEREDRIRRRNSGIGSPRRRRRRDFSATGWSSPPPGMALSGLSPGGFCRPGEENEEGAPSGSISFAPAPWARRSRTP